MPSPPHHLRLLQEMRIFIWVMQTTFYIIYLHAIICLHKYFHSIPEPEFEPLSRIVGGITTNLRIILKSLSATGPHYSSFFAANQPKENCMVLKLNCWPKCVDSLGCTQCVLLVPSPTLWCFLFGSSPAHQQFWQRKSNKWLGITYLWAWGT